MNLKEMKTNTEKNIVTIIKGMVKPEVEVKSAYDVEHNSVEVLLVQDTKKEVLESRMIYNITYDSEKDAVYIGAFNRHFSYDAYGVIAVINEAVLITEDFINGIKMAIKAGLETNGVLLPEPGEQPATETPSEAPAEQSAE